MLYVVQIKCANKDIHFIRKKKRKTISGDKFDIDTISVISSLYYTIYIVMYKMTKIDIKIAGCLSPKFNS